MLGETSVTKGHPSKGPLIGSAQKQQSHRDTEQLAREWRVEEKEGGDYYLILGYVHIFCSVSLFSGLHSLGKMMHFKYKCRCIFLLSTKIFSVKSGQFTDFLNIGNNLGKEKHFLFLSLLYGKNIVFINTYNIQNLCSLTMLWVRLPAHSGLLVVKFFGGIKS